MEFEFTKKVMLVGDDFYILDKVEKALKNESKMIDVITTSSMSKALKILEEKEFDVIVSDYRSLGIGGIEFLNEVRERKEIEIPFILFTEKKNQEIYLKVLKAGANRVIHRKDDLKLSCKVLHHAIKQEKLNYVRKKELKRHGKKFDNNNFNILNI